MRFPWRAWIDAWRDWINPIPMLAILLTLVFWWLLIFGDQGLLTWRGLAEKRRELIDQQTRLTEKQRQLEEEMQRLQDPHYVEPIIRRELGYVKPGETVFQFSDEAPPVP